MQKEKFRENFEGALHDLGFHTGSAWAMSAYLNYVRLPEKTKTDFITGLYFAYLNGKNKISGIKGYCTNWSPKAIVPDTLLFALSLKNMQYSDWGKLMEEFDGRNL